MIEKDEWADTLAALVGQGPAHGELAGCGLLQYTTLEFEAAGAVWIPDGVLSKIAEGLIRNAVENTPDGSRIDIAVRRGQGGPEFEIKDCGVGISAEDQRLIFEKYFTAAEALQYSTRKPFDFNAGGRGFDLLRMKIFSERYNFRIKMSSRPCRFIDKEGHECPGDTTNCVPLVDTKDCHNRGGTTVTVQFYPAERFSKRKASAKRKRKGSR